MAKISELAPADLLTGDERFPLVQGGATRGTSLAAFMASLARFLPAYFKGDPGSAGEAYATLDALAAAGDTARQFDDAYLAAAGREGKFVFQNRDFSTQVARDTGRGIYVCRAGDLSGATGAWVRIWDGRWAQASWFGEGWTGVVAAYRVVTHVELPAGRIRRTEDLHITTSVFGLRGAGMGRTTIELPALNIVAYADGVRIDAVDIGGFDLAVHGPAAPGPAWALGVFNFDVTGFDMRNVDIHHIGGSLEGHCANLAMIVGHGGTVTANCGVRDCTVRPGLRMFAEFVQHDGPDNANAMVGMYAERNVVDRANGDGYNIMISFSGAMTGCRSSGNRLTGGDGQAVGLELVGNHIAGDHEAWFDGSFGGTGASVTMTPNEPGSKVTDTRVRYRITQGATGRIYMVGDRNVALEPIGAIPAGVVIDRNGDSVAPILGPFAEYDDLLFNPTDRIKVTFPASSFWQADAIEVVVAGHSGSGGSPMSIHKTLFVNRLSGGSIALQDAATMREQNGRLVATFADPTTMYLSLADTAGTNAFNWHVRARRRGTGIAISRG